VFGRDMVWRRLLEAQPSEWRAILADPGFRAEHANTRRIRAAQVHALGVPAARWAPALLVARAALS